MEEFFDRKLAVMYSGVWSRACKGNINAARLIAERFDGAYGGKGQGSVGSPSVIIRFDLGGRTAEIETAAVTIEPVTGPVKRKVRKAARIAELEDITTSARLTTADASH